MTELQQAEGKLSFKWLHPSEISKNPLNWREHPEEQTKALEALIFGEDGVGWAGVGLVNNRTVENGWMPDEAYPTLIDGHDRQEIALARDELMPVLIGEWSPEEERKILLTFDPIGTLASTNRRALGDLLSRVKTRDENVQRMLEYINVKKLKIKETPPPDEKLDIDDEQIIAAGAMANRIYTFGIDQLVPNQWSAHAMSANEFNRLKSSIQKIGIIEPFIVRPLGNGKFEIVDGMQRYKACKELDIKTVQCIVRKYTEAEAKMASLASNRLRGKFIPKRLANILTDVRDEYGDRLVTETIGMEKKRMDSFGDVAGYEFKVDKEGVLERDYREYGDTDFTPLDERLTLIIALPSEDFHYVEEALNEISPNWSEAILTMAHEWRKYAPEERD